MQALLMFSLNTYYIDLSCHTFHLYNKNTLTTMVHVAVNQTNEIHAQQRTVIT